MAREILGYGLLAERIALVAAAASGALVAVDSAGCATVQRVVVAAQRQQRHLGRGERRALLQRTTVHGYVVVDGVVVGVRECVGVGVGAGGGCGALESLVVALVEHGREQIVVAVARQVREEARREHLDQLVGHQVMIRMLLTWRLRQRQWQWQRWFLLSCDQLGSCNCRSSSRRRSKR